MEFETLDIPGLLIVKPKLHLDSRGIFVETYRDVEFSQAVGQPVKFVQQNQSMSYKTGTIRGLHYQRPPHGQGKLVQCVYGSLLDIAVDIRRGSPTYGQHVSVKLSADNAHQFWIPEGFLHGFVTQEDNAKIEYKCTDYYAPSYEGSILWDDPALAIDWGEHVDRTSLSNRDKNAVGFEAFSSPFEYAR